MTQIQKKKNKKASQFWKKRLFRRHFHISFEMAKNQRENTDNMCQLIFLKTYPQQQKKWCKNPLYIYWECQTIYSPLHLKLHNTHLMHIFVDIYTLKFFSEKDMIARLNAAFKKLQEMGTKSLFLSFQNSFSFSYFPISQEPLHQNSSLTPLWNNNWKL